MKMIALLSIVACGLMFGLGGVLRAGEFETPLLFDGSPESTKEDLVKAYFNGLLEEQKSVAHELEAIELPSQEAAGGRYSRGAIVAIEWFSNGTIEPSDDGENFVREERFLYLIQIPLDEGFRRGWEQRTNAVALIEVTVVEKGNYESDKIASTRMVMSFDGFVDSVPTGIDWEE
tara:strand:+ start:256 stop:780 length:525 start_codon:yes stop_codon:yes gene_type:complete